MYCTRRTKPVPYRKYEHAERLYLVCAALAPVTCHSAVVFVEGSTGERSYRGLSRQSRWLRRWKEAGTRRPRHAVTPSKGPGVDAIARNFHSAQWLQRCQRLPGGTVPLTLLLLLVSGAIVWSTSHDWGELREICAQCQRLGGWFDVNSSNSRFKDLFVGGRETVARRRRCWRRQTTRSRHSIVRPTLSVKS